MSEMSSTLTRRMALAETALATSIRQPRHAAPRKVTPRSLPVLSKPRTPFVDYGDEYDLPDLNEDEIFAHEVRALPDIVPVVERPRPADGLSVTERLSTNRRERHDVSVEELHQELEALKHEIEAQIVATTMHTKEALVADAAAIQELFCDINEESCVAMTCEEFDAVREDVASRSLLRDEMILELIDALERIEGERSQRATELLKSYGRLLTAIAFASEPEVHRLMLAEANLVNLSLLENQRAVAELRARLLTAEVVRDRNAYVHWKERKAAWVTMKSDEILGGFLRDTEVSRVRQERYVDKHMVQLSDNLKALVSLRTDLLAGAKKLVPDMHARQSFETTFKEWVNAVHDTQAKIDDIQLRSYRSAANFVADEHQSEQAMLRQCQIALVKSGVCSAEEVTGIVEEGCGAPMRKQLGALDDFLADLEEAFALQQDESATVLAFLSQRTDALASVWAQWEEDRDTLMHELQVDLGEARAAATSESNTIEVQVDTVVDSIRQAPSPELLATAWTEVHSLMDSLCSGYGKTRSTVLGIISKVNPDIMALYRAYYTNLCAALGVEGAEEAGEEPKDASPSVTVRGRQFAFVETGPKAGAEPSNMAEAAAPAAVPGNKAEAAAAAADTAPGTADTAPPDTADTAPPDTADTAPPDTADTTPPDTAVPDTAEAAADGVVGVEAASSAEAEGNKATAEGGGVVGDAPAHAAVEQEQEPVPARVSSLADSEHVAVSALTTERANEIAKEMQLAWLDHLIAFEEDCVNMGEGATTREDGLANSEFQMQNHMHKARLGRLKTDVRNVRAAEFAVHRERVARHCAGMEEALQAEKQRFDAVCKESQANATAVATQMTDISNQVAACNSVRSLKNLLRDAETISESFKESTRSDLRGQRQKIDEVLRRLRESNGTLRTSLRTFSEGGNFSTTEINEYKVVLRMLSADIDETEGNILKVLNGMEVSLTNVAEEGMLTITELYEAHIKDVEYIGEVKEILSNAHVQVRSRVATDNVEAALLDTRVKALKTLVGHNRMSADAVKAANDVSESLRTRLASLACLLPTTLPAEPALAVPAPNGAGAHHTITAIRRGTTSLVPGMTGKGSRHSAGKRTPIANHRRKSRVQNRRENTIPVLQVWAVPPENSFLWDVNKVREDCRTAILDNLATPYYEGLRGKCPTRAGQIADVIQPFMEGIEAQLIAMFDKAVAYRKEAVSEYTDQVRACVKLLTSLSQKIFDSLAQESWGKLEKILDTCCNAHDKDVIEWLAQGKKIEQSVRPSLGHPNNTAELEAKCAAEASRSDDFVAEAEEYYIELGKKIYNEIMQVVASLQQVRVELFAALDKALLPDEIVLMPSEKKKSMKKLLKEKITNGDVQGNRETQNSKKVRVEREQQSWPAQSAPTPQGMMDVYAAHVMPPKTAEAVASSVTPMHTEGQAAYVAASKWFDEQLQSWSQKIAHQRQKEADLIETAKQRWALAVKTLKEPFSLA